ncbi:hypothetical protein [Pseudoalteromonas sp. SCQQ13]|uniref:hypothetical protein n=1 Tax=Pseudoalteromonas sp. SCQQ13 TaxID=2792066 RepID=UPI0018CF7236|nr:hypothetical protein [Pseudoalteromonas sp. SCQQ13]MBH0092287.1 hypothetical protein [Pseudoalteromonas sp. SCQQ13]
MAGFSSSSRPISKVVGAIEDHGFVILNALGPLGVAVFLTFVADWWDGNNLGNVSHFKEFLLAFKFFVWNPITGAIFFLLLTLWGAVGQAKDLRALKAMNDSNSEEIADLKLENDKLRIEVSNRENRLRAEVENNYLLAEELISSFKRMAHLWTCQIFNEMTFTVKHRISIYYLDSEKKNLVILDRFAKNHEFNQPGRPFFSRNQGVIGKAWAEGEYFDKSIPIFNRKNTNYYQYLDDNYGFSRDISSRLRMKSCTIGGFAIEDAHGHYIGVVIFESQDQNDFDDSKLRELVKRENHRLVEFISDASSRDMRPLPAQDGGRSEGEADEQKVA